MLAGCLLFTGCSGANKPEEVEPTTQKTEALKNELKKSNKDTLNIGFVDGGISQNPFEAKTKASVNVLNLVYDGMFAIGSNGNLNNMLVESYVKNDDGKFQFILRSGVTFHNGKAVTSDDIGYSIDLLKKSNTEGSSGQSVYANAKDAITGFEKVDDRTFILSLKSTGITPLYTLVFPIVSGDGKFSGTGSYKIDKLTNDKIELSFFEGGLVKNANIKKIEAIRFASYKDMETSYKANKVDMVFTDQTNLGLFKYHRNTKTVQTRTNEFYYIAPNLRRGTMASLKKRQVLSYAINRETVTSRAFDNFAVACDFPVPSDYFIYDTQIATYTYDVGTCISKLEDMGYALKKDGAREYLTKGSSKLSIKIIAPKHDMTQVNIAKSVASDLSDIGVYTTVDLLESSDYNKQLSSGNYDMAIGKANIGTEFDLRFMFSGANNINKVSSSNINSSLNTIANEPYDLVKVKEGYEKLYEYLIKELPIISLCFANDTVVISDRLYNVTSGYNAYDMLSNITYYTFEKEETADKTQVVD